MADPCETTLALCARCGEEELRGDLVAARALAARAWAIAGRDLERCIAAHYVAHFAAAPDDALAWHLRALALAEGCVADEVAPYLPSLVACVGRALRALGRDDEAAPYVARARALGFPSTGDDAGDPTSRA